MLIRHISRRLLPWLVSPWAVIAGGVVTALTMLAVCAVLLYDSREDALTRANESSLNTLLVVERDIARNVELYDLSLQAVVDGVGDPEVMALPRALRDSLLFDRAATAKDLGSMLVLDSAGNVIIDSGSATPRQANFADRSYFTVHRDNPHAGLYLSPPFRSRLRDGDPGIALSRRINKPDGSFGGIVVGTVRLEYFRRLLAGLQLGPNGAMALIHMNGQLIMRWPDDPRVVGRDLTGTGPFLRMVLQPEGRFSDEAPIDGIRRVYTFRHLPGLPLIMEVAPPEVDIYAAWRVRGNLRRPGDSAARYGGEEFVIVLPATTGPGALSVAETIRDEVFSLEIEHAGSVQGRITVSIGVATWQGKKSNTVESVVKAADEALYSAKAAGRNSVFATILA
ncbi:diguanylate cyclase [Paraburkholderia sp. BL10I2N1]|uniref:diguanylate cyclase n=1 Tax=Paraburkholderia sp. BL10I2N1 TaxID=1938796 RepID=UPI00105FF3A7|nr:diguanylate cyclase [Paraburkholderia sp. BL10I2N1]TDN61756.1 diguanylate cyclase (GGDEF)-like protein [Paraburkholderia sp. BL10I2N1]